MVLTMGSIAVSDARNHAHSVFYRRANPHMTLESLRAGHLEIVQAFAILGGSYLHYLNKPNLASVITGAALRMAVALGLHLEPSQKSEDLSDDARLQFETRRRTWWCLFCFDTWASATLGRPSLGRWDPGSITASLPTALDPEVSSGLLLYQVQYLIFVPFLGFRSNMPSNQRGVLQNRNWDSRSICKSPSYFQSRNFGI
jgi:hypothetical protein